MLPFALERIIRTNHENRYLTMTYIANMGGIDRFKMVELLFFCFGIKLWIKIDTGMNRDGVWYQQATSFISWLWSLPQIRVASVFTHFATAKNMFRHPQIAVSGGGETPR